MDLKKRLFWIDFAKGLAIIAVVVCHLWKFVFTDIIISVQTLFNVPLFVLMGGVNIYISYNRQKRLTWSFLSARLLKILIPYVVATTIFHILSFRSINIFDISILGNKLITFSAAPPFYFVEFYLELILVSPILFCLVKIIEKQKSYKTILLPTLAIFWVISNLLVFTKVPGGNNVSSFFFGGTHLFNFFLGLSFYPLINNLDIKKSSAIFSALAISCLIFSEIDIQRILPIPPNTYTIIYTLGVFLLIYSIGNFYNYEKHLLTKYICICGNYSIYIFLYHLLFIYLTKKIIPGFVPTQCTIIFYLSIATLGPIALFIGYKKLKEAGSNCLRKLITSSSKTL